MIKITVEIIFYRDASDISLEEVINDHWVECVSDIIKKTPLCKTLLLNCKKMVKDNKVLVNDKVITSNYKVNVGDKITILDDFSVLKLT